MKNKLVVEKSNRMLVSVSRTDEPICAVCGKPLGEHVLCYSVNSLQCVTVPLCVNCLRQGADMVEQANLVDSLSEIEFPAVLSIKYEDNTMETLCMLDKSFTNLEDAEAYFNELVKNPFVGKVSYETNFIENE